MYGAQHSDLQLVQFNCKEGSYNDLASFMLSPAEVRVGGQGACWTFSIAVMGECRGIQLRVPGVFYWLFDRMCQAQFVVLVCYGAPSV